MKSSIPPDPPPVTLVGGPIALAVSCVTLPLRVGEIEFPVNMMRDRSVSMPSWVQPPVSAAASKFATQFERDHRIVIHELLKRAHESIRAGTVRTRFASVTEAPILNRSRELVFRISFNDEDLVLHVSSKLTPCQLHVNQDIRCDAGQLFIAYDAALDYMQQYIDEIEAIGFDSTLLRLSMHDWERYRERLRLV